MVCNASGVWECAAVVLAVRVRPCSSLRSTPVDFYEEKKEELEKIL